MKKRKDSKHQKNQETDRQEETKTEGIVGMLISMHTFPLENERDLEEKKNLINELLNPKNLK